MSLVGEVEIPQPSEPFPYRARFDVGGVVVGVFFVARAGVDVEGGVDWDCCRGG